jgi:hypothetical protein
MTIRVILEPFSYKFIEFGDYALQAWGKPSEFDADALLKSGFGQHLARNRLAQPSLD